MSVLSARGRLGAAQRFSPESIPAARRDLAAEKIAAYVASVVSSAPPLTEEQRARIAQLLNPAGGAQ